MATLRVCRWEKFTAKDQPCNSHKSTLVARSIPPQAGQVFCLPWLQAKNAAKFVYETQFGT